MVKNRIDKTLAGFGQGLTLIETRTKDISNQFEVLQRQHGLKNHLLHP